MWFNVSCTAAAGGHLATLVWAHEDGGCEWTAQTTLAAAKGGHLQVLEYAVQNGCPWDVVACMTVADVFTMRWITTTVRAEAAAAAAAVAAAEAAAAAAAAAAEAKLRATDLALLAVWRRQAGSGELWRQAACVQAAFKRLRKG